MATDASTRHICFGLSFPAEALLSAQVIFTLNTNRKFRIFYSFFDRRYLLVDASRGWCCDVCFIDVPRDWCCDVCFIEFNC